MPLFQGSWPTTRSVAYATITKVEQTTATLLNASPNTQKIPGPIWADLEGDLTNPHLTRIFHLLLLILGIPTIWFYARRQRAKLDAKRERALQRLAADEAWRRPWLTDDWETLFGLMGLANDNKWTRETPFHAYPSIYKVWHEPHRPWLKRLMAHGIIPLAIHDGGMDIYRASTHGLEFKNKFPYIKFPQFIQAKKRACFEFLIPHPHHNAKRTDFLNAVIDNRKGRSDDQDHAYGVTVRYGLPGSGGRLYFSRSNPPPEAAEPFEVGAKSAIEPMLPFMSDTVIRRGHGARCNSISFYMRGLDPQRVPLLANSDTVLVRIEAKHFGRDQLDHFVFHLAQKVGLNVEWFERRCRDAAWYELQRCGIPNGGLRPYSLSVPERYETGG